MPLILYPDPSLSVAEQAQRLLDRGLTANRDELENLLGRVSYFRLSGYTWWYTTATNQFLPGTTLDEVRSLYLWDGTLRRAVMDLTEIVEVQLRTCFANVVGHELGPMGYCKPANANSTSALASDLGKLRERLSPPRETFLDSFYRDHNDPYPPVWMAAEVMSFGLISKWYDNLGSQALRKEIAGHFGFQAPVFTSLLRQLTVIRNICAHHSRLWNRHFTTEVVEPRSPRALAESLAGSDGSRIFRGLTMAMYAVATIESSSPALRALKRHLDSAKEEWLDEMDFPQGWREDQLWRL